MKGLLIRTAYNNQGWQGRCKEPLSDMRCYKCKKGTLFINQGEPITEDERGFCLGKNTVPLSDLHDEPIWCWEQVLCKRFFWGNPVGEWRQVYKGMPVFFVYQEPDSTYTLWGYSKIKDIDTRGGKTGYRDYPVIFFEPFEALVEEKRIKNLSAEELTGTKRWNMPFYRYLSEEQVNFLENLIKEGKKIMTMEKERYETLKPLTLKFDIHPSIFRKLEEIAALEGREIEELIREAIGELIREKRIDTGSLKTTEHERLEREFHEEMINIYRKAKEECNYNATRFLQMVITHGGLEAAKRLLRGEIQYGLEQLWECKCLHLSMEALVLKPHFRRLFTEEEINLAKERLRNLGHLENQEG